MLAETLRRHLTSLGYIAFLTLLMLAAVFVSTFNIPASMWPSLVTLLSMITGSALIGPEFSTGALQLIVSKPIRRSVYLLSRVAGVFVAVTLAAIVGLMTEAVTRFLIGSHSVPWQRLASAFSNALAAALVAIALLTLLGSMTRSYFNAAIYVGTGVALSVAQAILGLIRARQNLLGQFLRDYPVIERFLDAVDETLFPDMPQGFDAVWLLRVLATAAIALGMACAMFERREVPYAAE